MVVISAGMQKSGSAYMYNLINDLLSHSGNADARNIKKKYSLDKSLLWYNNNAGDLDMKLLIKLLLISLREKKFVVKTHEGPSAFLLMLLKLRLVRVIYIP